MAKSPGNPFRRTDLFVVRIWRAGSGDPADHSAGGEGPARWQGRVQRAVSGETHYFQGWPALIEVLEAMLSADPPATQSDTRGDGRHK